MYYVLQPVNSKKSGKNWTLYPYSKLIKIDSQLDLIWQLILNQTGADPLRGTV